MYEYTMTRRRTLTWFTVDKSLPWPLDKPAALQIEDNAGDEPGDEASDKPAARRVARVWCRVPRQVWC